MRNRPKPQFRPSFEPLEAKRPLSAGVSAAAAGAHAHAHAAVRPDGIKPNFGYLVYRITQPNRFNNHFTFPFGGHVLVQNVQPVPGQSYNILQISVRNGTLKTFTAADNFSVKVSNQNYFTPILTGDQTWKPGQWFIFYIMTKKYYPLKSQVTSGFVFDLGGAKSVAIPGPSGIFLRVRYNPATINNVLDHIVVFGQGNEGGVGVKYGMPNTSIYSFASAQTHRNDYGGLF